MDIRGSKRVMLKQKTPLKRKTPLKAKTPLKKGTSSLKRSPIKIKAENIPKPKQRKPLKAKIKKTPKRISILTDNMDRCYLCSPSERKHSDVIQIHEVFFGSFRKKSIEWGCTVPLCLNHHTASNKAVHVNRENDLALKKKCQKEFENRYGHNKYMEIFKINYLD